MPPFDTSEDEGQQARDLCRQPVVVAERMSDSAGRTAEHSISLAVTGFLTAIVVIGIPAVAYAGMPSINLTDLGRMRLNAISFFVGGFLVSAWGIQLLWNLLQRDFPRLPRLTFKAAAGVVFLWGMLFVLVLTMISGARELMTPGAWEIVPTSLTHILVTTHLQLTSPLQTFR